jgi:hypothetical protein
MPSATLLYTAQLLHPSDPSRCILELDTSVEIEWEEGYEAVHHARHLSVRKPLEGWFPLAQAFPAPGVSSGLGSRPGRVRPLCNRQGNLGCRG